MLNVIKIPNDEERMRSGSDNLYEYPQPIPACQTHDKLTHTIGFNYIPESQCLKANFQTSTIFAATFRAVQPLV